MADGKFTYHVFFPMIAAYTISYHDQKMGKTKMKLNHKFNHLKIVIFYLEPTPNNPLDVAGDDASPIAQI